MRHIQVAKRRLVMSHFEYFTEIRKIIVIMFIDDFYRSKFFSWAPGHKYEFLKKIKFFYEWLFLKEYSRVKK